MSTRERDAHDQAGPTRERERLDHEIDSLNDDIEATRARLVRAQNRTDHLAPTAATQASEQLDRLQTDLAIAQARRTELADRAAPRPSARLNRSPPRGLA